VYIYTELNIFEMLCIRANCSPAATRGQYDQQKQFGRKAILLNRVSKPAELAHGISMKIQIA